MYDKKSVFVIVCSALLAGLSCFTLPVGAQIHAPSTVSSRILVEGAMPRCMPPKIEFEILVQPAEIRNVASVKTMTTYSKSSHPTVGLYRSRQRVYMRGQRIGSADTNELCVTSLFITYAINHAIDIGNEYKPGTCAFEETVKHERTHERIHLQKAREAQNHIAQQLGRQPLYFSGPSYQQEANTWMSKSVEWATQVYTGYIMPAQDAFDSPDEYHRFAKACEQELRYQGYNGAGTR
jgi:hypothetical protein